MTRRWLPQLAFGLLALATIGAFFLIQALKTANPLVWGPPKPVPAAFDPIHGRTASCVSSKGKVLNYRQTQIQFGVPRADSVGVYIVTAGNASGAPVATISTGTPMQRSILGSSDWYPKTFTWNGLLNDGAVAPDGTYYFRIVLQHEGRSIDLSDSPVHVITTPASARVVSVSLPATGGNSNEKKKSRQSGKGGQKAQPEGPAVLTPPHGEVKITYTRGGYRRLWIDIYRTDVSGHPREVTQFPADASGSWKRWNGMIGQQPAPAGTYLVGLTAQNAACDQSKWPTVVPPPAGTTPHAGVSIRYLTVTPPLTPTVSGARASVAVSSPAAGFTWRLRRSGTTKLLGHGSGPAGSSEIQVRMPRHLSGLYTLVVRSGPHAAAVPLVASQAGPVAARARVLVVLPMLTWIGNSPVDDTGDGLPDTLSAGDAVSLDRPLVDGPPASLSDDAALLAFLTSEHLSYQLTTDVALAEGRGPSLVNRWGVLFPDGEDYLPASLARASSTGSPPLTSFVQGGGRVLTLGTGTFTGVSRLSGSASSLWAGVPSSSKADLFGARRGRVTPTGGALITELTDQLGLFGGILAFSGFSQYQPIEPPGSQALSAAGISEQSAAIVGFRYGSGIVVEVGLPNFGSSLPQNIDSQDLLLSAWHLLANGR